MLIDRSINLSLIVYLDAIVNQAIRSLKSLRNKSRKVREFVYERVLSRFPMSSTLYCYVRNAKNIFKKKKFMFNCRSRFGQSIGEI